MTALPATPTGAREKHWLNRTLIGAGVTSALGDFCYETMTVMPLARHRIAADAPSRLRPLRPGDAEKELMLQ